MLKFFLLYINYIYQNTAFVLFTEICALFYKLQIYKPYQFLNWYLLQISNIMWIKSFLKRHPSIGKGLISAFFFVASDAITQLFIEKKQFDWYRNLQFFALGIGIFAPCIQIWYSNLLPKITAKYISHMGKFKQTIARLAIDTLVFAPVTYTAFYLFKDVIFRRDRSNVDYKQQVKQKFILTLLIDWVVWFPLNFVNFWCVPLKWQGIYVGIFTFFFNIILSYIANMEVKFDKQIQRQTKQAIKNNQHVHHQQQLAERIIHKIHPKKIQIIF